MSPPGLTASAVKRAGVFGVFERNSSEASRESSISLVWSTQLSAPGPQTSTHSRQPVHFHGSMVTE